MNFLPLTFFFKTCNFYANLRKVKTNLPLIVPIENKNFKAMKL